MSSVQEGSELRLETRQQMVERAHCHTYKFMVSKVHQLNGLSLLKHSDWKIWS